MNIIKRFSAWIKRILQAIWGVLLAIFNGTSPTINFYQNNFEIKKILKRNEELVEANKEKDIVIRSLRTAIDKIKAENSAIKSQNTKVLDENKALKVTQDVFGLVLEQILPHITMDQHHIDHYLNMIEEARKNKTT